MKSQPTEATTYQGGAFHPDLAGGQASGTLRIAHDGVHFESAKGSVTLPLGGLNIAMGGANDRLIFFTHPGQPQVTIHTPDHAVLAHPVLTRDRSLRTQIDRVHHRKRTALAVILAVVGVLVAGLVVLVLSRDRIASAATAAIPVNWEIVLGDKLFDQVSRREKLVSSAELDAQLKSLTAPMLEGIKDARYPLQFHIVEDATLNAFAIPGGHVVIHSGLLLAADTPEQVAGVLAHEIAHVTRRHGFRSVLSTAGLYLVIQTFVGDLSGLMAVIVNNSAFLVDRKFSRDFEREADETGWNYLLQARVNPHGMIEFFQKLAADEEKRTGDDPLAGAANSMAFLSTHPATKERMAHLESKWQEVSGRKDYLTFKLNYAQFKDTLRSNLHSAPKPPGEKKGK